MVGITFVTTKQIDFQIIYSRQDIESIARCSGNCNQENNSNNWCLSHGIHVTVLQMIGNCGEWVWGQQLLPIACTCTRDVIMNT